MKGIFMGDVQSLLKREEIMSDGTSLVIQESGSISIQEFSVTVDGVMTGVYKLENYKNGKICRPVIKKQIDLPEKPMHEKTGKKISFSDTLKNGMKISVEETGGFTQNEVIIYIENQVVSVGVIKESKKRKYFTTIKSGVIISGDGDKTD
jgi:hypothetical protein